jgi:hypothetical protein
MHPLNRAYCTSRTDPVIGSNSIYAVGLHIKCVDDVTNVESDAFLKSFWNRITQNHDLQVRLR